MMPLFLLLFVRKVDYQEKQFAQGVIPSTYLRREGAPKERELLCGRLIDRPIRPLFPAGFYHEVQVCCYCFACPSLLVTSDSLFIL